MTRMSRIGVALASLLLVAGAANASAATKTFGAHLSGKDLFPTRETSATGEAKFNVSTDGTQIDFRVNVANISNVVTAAIYAGNPGETGPVAVMLYGPVAPAGGPKTGVLAKGTITANQLLGQYAGRTISDLVAAMQAGSVYVLIATDDGSGVTEQKAGNFTTGEIRGQIR